MRSHTQYALLHKDSQEPATFTHQDDLETPLVDGSLDGLIDKIGDWCDCGYAYVLKHLQGDTFRDELRAFKDYVIVRQVVETDELSADDLAELAQLRAGEDGEEGD